jgi:hypothetical protein
MFVVGFAIGLGAVSWVIMSEIMSTRLRTKAFGLFVSINWGFNLVIGLTTLSGRPRYTATILHQLSINIVAIDFLGGTKNNMDDDETADARKEGVAYMYIILAGVCTCATLFILGFVPETKGKSAEDFLTEYKGEKIGKFEVSADIFDRHNSRCCYDKRVILSAHLPLALKTLQVGNLIRSHKISLPLLLLSPSVPVLLLGPH